MTEASSMTFHGVAGNASLFAYPHCETDRFWRTQLSLTPERYFRDVHPNFDECRNAYMKPKAPAVIDVLDNLHKRSDYE